MLSFACGTRDKLKQRAARTGNPTRSSGQRYLPKRDRFILVGFIWGNVALQRSNLLSPVAWKSAALSEVCGKFWTRRAHRGFAIINPQVERLSIYGVVDPSRFCRILQECRRISCGLTAHLPQRRPLPLVEKRPQILRIDDGKGFRRFGAPVEVQRVPSSVTETTWSTSINFVGTQMFSPPLRPIET